MSEGRRVNEPNQDLGGLWLSLYLFHALYRNIEIFVKVCPGCKPAGVTINKV